MKRANPLPRLWLLSDARNDEVLEHALARLPRGSGLIFRHYHLPVCERRRRFAALRRRARARGHVVILAESAARARAWGAEGVYGPARALTPRRAGLIRLASAHDLAELGVAARLGADAVLLSPVFPTRSHPGAAGLGPVRFLLLARRSRLPVIALGGMTARRARALGWLRWAGIDAFVCPPPPTLSVAARAR
jgi:thiamine-phosphate pyrophosphorylase